MVRLWNPYVTAKPVAILRGHISRVLDVIIEEQNARVFSYDCDTVRNAFEANNKNIIAIHITSILLPIGYQSVGH